ncbi:metallophosphoesterase [Lysinibacillus mangiferihumi]|uniref:Metallophosphoesterase n=1 Tax=Lysinibacillus mangiferihumi TaxID=1130819 RepID=A0A4U2ZAN3_9BACI|nr:metallophosphoesterase [Lysinibacillus mangiferihumi]TKI71616.1 metallophosphoesterase [Lysinibacillus mangiferihumi]
MKNFKIVVKIVLLVVVLIGLLVGYAFKIEPKMLVVHSYHLNEDKGESVKIVQISDIQVSETYTVNQLNRLVEKINQISPDMIVFTGDLFENFSAFPQKQEVTDSLSQLNATVGKFAVWGNRDYGGGAFKIYEDLLTNADFTLLNNNGVTVPVSNDKKLFIGGIDDGLLGKPDIDLLLSQMDDTYDYEIVLMHEPDMAELLKDTSVNLLLAGHSHGGQIRIPFMKTIKTSLAEKYDDGFYTINKDNGMQLYVNTGIGTSRIAARFMVPPEIAVFTIHL